ncbi:MAG: HAMP domain-containing sensor histidine kinase [Pseudomonadota bacterium]
MKHLFGKLARSSSYQVGTLFAVLMLFSILFVSYWLVIASGDTLLGESEEAVRAEMRGLITLHDIAGLDALKAQLAHGHESGTGFLYALRDVEGALVAGNLPLWPDPQVERLKEGLILFEIDNAVFPDLDQSLRPGSDHLDIMAKMHRFDQGYEMLVGRNVDDLEIAQFVARTFGWVMILILVLIFALSYGVAYYVASRFERIAATTGRIIETGNLAERLPVDSSWDDLSKLSVLLNRMLEELELRVDGIKSVSDSIAHDLRTPLMRLRAMIDESAQGDARNQLLEELDRTLGVFQSLLRISAIEAGKQTLERVDVDVAAVATDAAAMYEPLAEEAQIKLVCSAGAASVSGDRDLLFQAIANVVDNAVKFTPSGGSVSVAVANSDNTAVIVVSDTGPGIPESEREAVLQRFRRLDDSRSKPGNGLGLPLVQAIVHRHGGSLTLAYADAESQSGLKATITLPAR